MDNFSRRVLHSALMFFALSVSSHAGEDTFDAGDIVAFFDKQKIMVATRGICVGSDEECAAAELKDHSAAFDLRINFEKNSSELTEDARKNLIEFSVALRNPKLTSLKFTVDGFTDASGDADHNLNLSWRRSASVVSFLESLGVGSDMLMARGWGETNFRTADALDPVNRRVETRIARP
jgi:OmpA-OmpF porin, OOP family